LLLGVVVGSGLWLRQIRLGHPTLDTNLAVFHIVNLGGILSVTIALYDVEDWRDYRVLAPHLLLSFILLILVPVSGRLVNIALAVAIAFNLSMAPVFVDSFRTVRTEAFRKLDFSTANPLATELAYLPSTNGWCNTILLPEALLDRPELLLIPPGIGLSWSFDLNRASPPRSHYLLLDPPSIAVVERQSWKLELVSTTSVGNLYRNPHAGCETPDKTSDETVLDSPASHGH
jgi:hypothetical protein